MSEIILPDLPMDLPGGRWNTKAVMAYAQAAVELDRQGRGEPVGRFTGRFVMGPGSKALFVVEAYGAIPGPGAELFTAPQPTDPVVKESLTVAEPVKVPSVDDVVQLCSSLGWQDVEPGDVYELVIAALNRYGQPAQPTASAEPAKVPLKLNWEPCNPACDPELGGWKDRRCDCDAANNSIAAQCAEPVVAQPSLPEHLIKTLQGLADLAYINYIQQMRQDDCLGWEAKVSSRKFTEKNIAAHTKGGELLGRHRAFSEAANMLKGQK